MAVVMSDRERRLWIWTAVLVAGIFATLGVATVLADELGRRGLFDGLFAFGALLVLAMVVLRGWRSRPSGHQVAVALGVVAVYAIAFARMAIPEERTHLVEYGAVAVLAHAALEERAASGRGPAWPAAAAIGVATAVGVVDELVQLVIPSRVFDVRDIGFNVAAACMSVSGTVLVRRARRT